MINNSIKKLASGLVVSAISACAFSTAALALQPDTDHMHVIKPVENVEDLAVLDNDWVVGSGLPDNQGQGHFYLFNTHSLQAQSVIPLISVKPDSQHFPSCTTAPDFSKMATHGLDYDPNTHLLYAVAHESREAVEVFKVSMPDHTSDSSPHFTWEGCIPSPKGTYIDAVAAMDHDRVILTDISDLTQASNVEKVAASKPAGGLYMWSPEKGMQKLPIGDTLSAPNGVLATHDGRVIFVVLTGTREIMRLQKDGDKYQVSRAKVPYSPDNIRWTSDHRQILVGGQVADFKAVVACNEEKTNGCTYVPSQLDVLDPDSLRLTSLLPAGIYAGLTSGTGAVVANNQLWLSSTKSDRIVVIPLKK